MSVCNLFRKLSKDTGNFLMFSQYTDDLTRWMVRHNDAKVIPSRFIAMNIDYSNLSDKLETLGLMTTLNEGTPNLMQNYYENACAFFKDYAADNDDFEWTPETSRAIFWNTLRDNGLLTFKDFETDAISDENTGLKIPNEVVYRGDINIQSYTEEDNIGYNEIYCYIPNDAQRTEYCVKVTDDVESVLYPKEYVEGYSADDEGFTGLLNIAIPYNTQYRYNEGMTFLDENDEDLESYSQDDASFQFNTIVVLYDIYQKNGDEDIVTSKDIPLGMYFTGTISEEGEVSNAVTKYWGNSDIYGAGTSYGLRLATRFVATPNATYIKEISIGTDDDNAEFCKVMSSFSESQEKMNQVLSTIEENSLDIKNHLSAFKNYRTNIPYVVQVGDTKYWFVNGKNTNATVQGSFGPQGVTGERGPKGDPGTGPQGVTGLRGVTGYRGTQGPRGYTGNQGLTGLQGITGLRGIQGMTGLRGPIGPTGSKMIFADNTINGDPNTYPNVNAEYCANNHLRGGDYVVLSKDPWNGDVILVVESSGGISGSYPAVGNIRGPQGVTGLRGATGLKGIQGLTGPQGIQGIQGITGLVGPTGPSGGPIGPTGVTGPQGVTGAPGAIQYTAGTNIGISGAEISTLPHVSTRAVVTDEYEETVVQTLTIKEDTAGTVFVNADDNGLNIGFYTPDLETMQPGLGGMSMKVDIIINYDDSFGSDLQPTILSDDNQCRIVIMKEYSLGAIGGINIAPGTMAILSCVYCDSWNTWIVTPHYQDYVVEP